MSRQQILTLVLLAMAVVVAAMYFPWDRSGRVQVTGSVFLDGKPLDVIRGSAITFSPAPPIGNRPDAIGLIEKDGRYRLDTTRREKGLLPGSYRVGLKAWKREPGWDDTKSGQPLPPPAVPEHYWDVETSGIVVEVTKAGRQSIDIRVSSTDKPPTKSRR